MDRMMDWLWRMLAVLAAMWWLLALLLAVNVMRARRRYRRQHQTLHDLHTLGTAGWHTAGFFDAACGCGTTVYGKDLPQLWAAHDVHLRAVHELARRRHPSAGGHR